MFFLAVAIPSYAITYGGLIIDPPTAPEFLMGGQNVLDLLALTFSACLPILNRNRIVNVFTTERIGTSHVFSLGLLLWSMGVCLSALSAIHWRASGHLASLNDGGGRVVFRVLYDLGFACMLVASGPYQEDLSLTRMAGVLKIFAMVLALIAFMLFGDVARGYLWPTDTVPDWTLMERGR